MLICVNIRVTARISKLLGKLSKYIVRLLREIFRKNVLRSFMNLWSLFLSLFQFTRYYKNDKLIMYKLYSLTKNVLSATDMAQTKWKYIIGWIILLKTHIIKNFKLNFYLSSISVLAIGYSLERSSRFQCWQCVKINWKNDNMISTNGMLHYGVWFALDNLYTALLYIAISPESGSFKKKKKLIN